MTEIFEIGKFIYIIDKKHVGNVIQLIIKQTLCSPAVFFDNNWLQGIEIDPGKSN